MSHFFLFCTQVRFIVFLRRDFDRHALHDFYAKPVQPVNFVRIVCQKPKLLRSKVL